MKRKRVEMTPAPDSKPSGSAERLHSQPVRLTYEDDTRVINLDLTKNYTEKEIRGLISQPFQKTPAQLVAVLTQNGKELKDLMELVGPTVDGTACDITLFFAVDSSPSPQATKVQCSRCKEFFAPEEMKAQTCRKHPGKFLFSRTEERTIQTPENEKLGGEVIDDAVLGLTYKADVHRWSCCNSKQQTRKVFTQDQKLELLFAKPPAEVLGDDDVQIIEPQQLLQPVHLPGHADIQGNDLTRFVDPNQSYCLNESKDHTAQSVLSGGTQLLESDVDEQLLICVSFTQNCRVIALRISGPDDGRAPCKVRLFTNQANMDFSNVDSFPPAQTMALKEADIGPNGVVKLNALKFPKCKSIVVFIESNQGDEPTTGVTRLQFIGQPLHLR